jgi:ferric-dicitrate binding protein FerR (iron transport regulator)
MDPQIDDDSGRDDALMRRLFALLGRRAAPGEAVMRRAEDAFREALAPIIQRRKSTRNRIALSIAATLLAAVGIGVIVNDRSSNPTDSGAVANLVKSIGPVEVMGDAASGHAAGAIRIGQVLMTGANGRASLRYRGADVRLDVATTVRFDPARLVLERGAIYVDTGDARPPNEPPVLVETRFGMLGHTGTQFMAKLDADRLTVGVREGTVFAESRGNRRDMSAQPHRASSAEVDASGNIQVHEVTPFGGMWSWVPEASPGYAVEGSSVDTFLRWLGREHGYSLQYDGPASEARAKTTVLHGDLNGLSMADAIAVVNATTQLDVDLESTGTVSVALEGNHDADPGHDGQ